VEVKAIVKAGVGEIDEVAGGDGHLVHEDLGLEGAHRGVEDGDRVGRCLRGERPDCGALDESRLLHRTAGEGGARGAQAGGADGSGDGGGGGNHLRMFGLSIRPRAGSSRLKGGGWGLSLSVSALLTWHLAAAAGCQSWECDCRKKHR